MAWLSGYSNRKKGSVNATTAGSQTLYQLKLIVGESSGASGEDIDCENHCVDFPNDIRFTKEDELTKHDYWVDTSSLEGTTPNRKVTVWIEVASIPASGSVDFYMYYGKSSDSGESDGDNTFKFFDDFSKTIEAKYLTNWTKHANNPLQAKTCQNWLIAVYSNYNSEDKIYIFEQRHNHPNTTIECWSFTRANAATPANWTDHGVVYTATGAHENGHVEPHGIIFETQSMSDAREGVGPGEGTRKWRMYYCAKGSGENESKYSANFCYAAESDLTSWTAYTGNPVYDHDASYGWADSKVCIYDNKVWMHHCRYTDTVSCNPSIFSVSDNGIDSWTDKTKSWYTERTVLSTLIPFGTGILLGGNLALDDTYRAHFTTDGDDKADYSGNPILSRGATGQWDDSELHWFTIPIDKNGNANLNNAGTYYLYYIANDGTTNKLGLATSTTLTEESTGTIDSDKWTTIGTPTIASGVATIVGTSVNCGIHAKSDYGMNHRCGFRAKMHLPVGGGTWDGYGLHGWDDSMDVATPYEDFVQRSAYDVLFVLSTPGYSGSLGSAMLGAWARYEATRKATSHEWLIDDVSKHTENSPHTGVLSPTYFSNTAKAKIEVDYVYVGKYISPEPTWGGWGGEESSLVPKTSFDIGSGADATVSGNPFGTFSKSETGAGVDALSVRLAFLLKADTGTGADALTELLASLVLTDSGAGADLLIDVYKVIQKFSTDLGTGIDLRTELLGILSQLDSGSGIESLGSRLLGSLDQGAGKESGEDTSDEASYGGVSGVSITHNFNLSDYIALISSIADPDASVGEVYINSIAPNAFTIYNSGSAKSKFRWWIPIDPYDKGDSTFAGLGGRTLTHTKGDTDYVPCIIPSALGGGAIGEWWITDIANTSFVVHNSGNATTTFSWAIPRYDNGCKGASTFAGEAGITITHSLDAYKGYTVLIVPTEKPNGHLGAVYVTDATANSFKVKNTGVATTSFLWIIYKVRTFSLLATLLESDSGLGTDALALLTLILVCGDSGVGTDTLAELSAALSKSDQGTGADALAALFAAIIKSDSGSAIELLQKKIFNSFDQGAGVDTVSELLASMIRSDSGIGSDAAARVMFVFILLKLFQEVDCHRRK